MFFHRYGSKTAAIEGSVINTGSKNYPQFKIEAFVLTGRKGKTGEPAKAPSATEAPEDMADSMPETCEIKPESDTKYKEAIANKPTPDPGTSAPSRVWWMPCTADSRNPPSIWSHRTTTALQDGRTVAFHKRWIGRKSRRYAPLSVTYI